MKKENIEKVIASDELGLLRCDNSKLVYFMKRALCKIKTWMRRIKYKPLRMIFFYGAVLASIGAIITIPFINPGFKNLYWLFVGSSWTFLFCQGAAGTREISQTRALINKYLNRGKK